MLLSPGYLEDMLELEQLIDNIHDDRKIVQECREYRGLIVRDLALFLESLVVDLDRIRLEYMYGPYYN
jgi:hypothetical protein